MMNPPNSFLRRCYVLETAARHDDGRAHFAATHQTELRVLEDSGMLSFEPFHMSGKTGQVDIYEAVLTKKGWGFVRDLGGSDLEAGAS